jgi:hypothetical protein
MADLSPVQNHEDSPQMPQRKGKVNQNNPDRRNNSSGIRINLMEKFQNNEDVFENANPDSNGN